MRLLLLTAIIASSAVSAQTGYPFSLPTARDGQTLGGVRTAQALNASGGFIQAGVFQNGDFDVDPGPDTVILEDEGSSINVAYIASYGADGSLLYASTFNNAPRGQNSRVSFTEVVGTPDGGAIAIGTFEQGVDFDPGSGETILTPVPPSTFVVALDGAGALRYAFKLDGIGSVIELPDATSIALDESGVLWVAGTLRDPVPFDFDPGPGTAVRTPRSRAPAVTVGFLASYNADGTFRSADLIEGGDDATANVYSVSPRPGGGVVVTGRFVGALDFGLAPGAGTQDAGDRVQGFVAVYGADRSLARAFQLGGAFGGDTVYEAAVGADGSIAIVGEFEDEVDLDPGPGQSLAGVPGANSRGFYVVSYAPDGSLRYGLNFNPEPSPMRASPLQIARGADDSIVVGGVFEGSFDFDFSDSGERVLSNASSFAGSAFVAGYDATTGANQFASGILQGDRASTSGVRPRTLVVRDDGRIAVSGEFIGDVEVGSGPDVVVLEEEREGAFFVFLNADGSLARGPGGGTATGDTPADALALRVAPNPAVAGSARVEVAAQGRTRVAVLDVLGREVAVLFDGAAAGRRLSLSVPSQLSPGTYVVRVTTADRSQAAPFTVVR